MRYLKTLVLVLFVVLLASCETREEQGIELPDLSGFTEEELIIALDDANIKYEIAYIENDGEFQNVFIRYIDFEIGDIVSEDDVIRVMVYESFAEEYFQVIDMMYDGPTLDEGFKDINYLDPRGGYFEVTLKYCTDGDTAIFDYPEDVYQAIDSNAKSTRFLNMDTEETYSGGEEEWGKPASVYTCDLLESATEIVLQTDPGDNLLGNYGRLLAWVWVKLPNEDEFHLLNYMVVKQGLAQVKYEFGAGTTISYGDHTYNEWMHIAEDYAKEQELGQWGSLLDYYWDYTTNQPDYAKWGN